MKIAVSGGTGFLGSALCRALVADGHEVVVLTRSAGRPGDPGVTTAVWTPDGSVGPWARALDGAGAVVNLAGASLADRRWTPSQKALLRDSRILATRSLVEAMGDLASPPPVLISGSAIGYYGYTRDGNLTEADPPGSDFLAALCVDWEAEASRAASRARVVLVRTGVVLERGGGALDKLVLPFRLFAGGPLGSGRQPFSWIHRDDWIALVRWALETNDVVGPLNATAPEPVTNAELCRAVGRALGRPCWLPAPAFALRLALGAEMAEAMLLGGQRVVPDRATGSGFSFRHPTIESALSAIF